VTRNCHIGGGRFACGKEGENEVRGGVLLFDGNFFGSHERKEHIKGSKNKRKKKCQ